MSRREHPSDRLVLGPVADFEEALQLVRAQWDEERVLGGRGASTEALRSMDDELAQINAALRHAGRVWREEQERARLRTIERLREDMHAAEAALDDEAARWLELLAASLEDGDYGRLAI